MITRVWLIRHGEPSDEVQGRCYGALDIGLSAFGKVQMEQVARRLQSEPLAAIYSSPLRRARESAQILALKQDCSYQEVVDLREISFGDFEGLTYDDIAARYAELYAQWMEAPTEVQFPNGECFAGMRQRVLQGFEAIQRSRAGQTIAIVTHGGVIRILLGWVLQIPDRHLFRLAQDYASMNLLTWVEGVPAVQSMNIQC